MAVRLRVRHKELTKLVQRQLEAGLDAVWVDLQAIARRMASIQNRPQRQSVKRSRKGGNAKSRTTWPHSSKPGESPRRRTGFGQRNIVGGRFGMRARVGYTRAARYMTFHELGIRYTKAGLQRRPTIVPALRNNQPRLEALFMRAAKRKRPQ